VTRIAAAQKLFNYAQRRVEFFDAAQRFETFRCRPYRALFRGMRQNDYFRLTCRRDLLLHFAYTDSAIAEYLGY
jgi:hypothetical protein